MILLLLLVAVLLLMVMRLPVALALALPSVFYLWREGFGLEIVAQRLVAGVDSFPLLAVPLFMLAGGLMNAGGITERIYGFVEKALGHVRGSLGYVNVAGSVIFSGMSGAAVVDAAGLGAVEIRAMREANYDDGFSVGITAASSTIGPIIPPSIPAVVYGVTAGVSIGGLFVAGILPGLLMALCLVLAVYLYTVRNDVPTSRRESLGTIVASFGRALPALFTPALIILGILSGLFTPTEAGAVAVGYAAIISILLYRANGPRELWALVLDTAVMSASILIIVACSSVFAWVLALEQAPQLLAELVLGLTDNPYVFLLLVNVVLLFVGMVLEPITAILILVPVLQPLTKAFGDRPDPFRRHRHLEPDDRAFDATRRARLVRPAVGIRAADANGRRRHRALHPATPFGVGHRHLRAGGKPVPAAFVQLLNLPRRRSLMPSYLDPALDERASAMRELIELYYDGCNTADIPKMVGCFTPDAVHYFPPGMYEGPFRGAEVIARKWAEAVDRLGSYWVIDNLMLEPERWRAVLEWSHFKTKQGIILRGDEWLEFEPESGLIREIRAYYASPQADGLERLELGGFDYGGQGFSLRPPPGTR